MSNVKLVTPWDESILSEVSSLGVIVLDARNINKESLLELIFRNKKYKIVILGDFQIGSLPVPDYVFLSKTQMKDICLKNFIMNSCERTYSADGVLYYDVHDIWYVTRHNDIKRSLVRDIMYRHYGGTDLTNIDICVNEEEISLIHSANLNFPIHLNPDGTVIDGCHRLLKAFMNSYDYIDCVYVSEEQLKLCAV